MVGAVSVWEVTHHVVFIFILGVQLNKFGLDQTVSAIMN